MPIGMPEILIVLVIVLVLFGPKKLPQLARAVGEAFKEYKKGMKDAEDADEQDKPAKKKDAKKKKGKKRAKKLAG